MREGPDIARIASLVGDPARANMLTALMAGRALTATELAEAGGITVQTASTHLAKLEAGGLLSQRKQGRHRYFTLADDAVGKLLEGIMGFYPVRLAGPLTSRSRNVRLAVDRRRRSWSDDGVTVSIEYKLNVSRQSMSIQASMAPTILLSSGAPRSLMYWKSNRTPRSSRRDRSPPQSPKRCPWGP